MIDENMLDNLTTKEIKEMIKAKELKLQELNTSALQKLMSYEIDMLCFGEGDVDLICKCSDLLDKINPCPMSDEEFMAIVKKAEKEHVIITEDKSAYRKVPKARILLKRIAIIAAVVIILTTATVGVASAFGVDIFEDIYKISRQSVGTRKDIDGLTLYHGDRPKYYSSIEEITKEKDWEILYPHKFPDNVTVDSVASKIGPRQNEEININTNDNQIKINIERNIPKKDWNENELSEQESIYETNGIKYLIIPYEDVYYAICYYNGDYYSIQAGNHEDLILIIDNLKEIEK